MSDQPRNDIPGLDPFVGPLQLDDLFHVIDSSAAHPQDRKATVYQLVLFFRSLLPPVVQAIPPTPAHDGTLDFAVGTMWLNTSGPTLYMCTDATENNAVWRVIVDWSGGGGGVS